MVAKTVPQNKGFFMEYKIKDINLAIEGRKELDLAETENVGPHGSPQGIRRQEAARRRAHHG